MTPGQLAQAHTDTLRRHWRALVDAGGRATPGYLADLADLAEVAEGVKPERGQLAIVLDRIAEHSADADIRDHIRLVAQQLRGSGLVIINGPPSAAESKPAPRRKPPARKPAAGRGKVST